MALVFTMSFNVNAQDINGELLSQCNSDLQEVQYNYAQCQGQLNMANANSLGQTQQLQTENYLLELQVSNLQEQLNSLYTQSQIDSAYNKGVYDSSPVTMNNLIEAPLGWSIFGYHCLDSADPDYIFSDVSENIEMIKDELGLSYLPSWNFNAMGDLKFGEGYQIKVINEDLFFDFCEVLSAPVFGCTDESADNYNEDANTDDGTCSIAGCMNNEAQNYNEGATYDDGSCIIIGCTDQNAFNYNSNATEDDGSCVDIIYGCTNWSMCNYDPLANTNDGSCYNNDIGCGCDVPAPQEGYNCLGLPVLASVGDTLFGGIVFYMDDLGQSGLIAAMSDISGSYQFGCNGSFVSAFNWNIGGGQANTTNISNSCGGGSAAGRANNFTFDDYNDWFLPSIYSLEEIYNSIGPGGLNLTDFANSFYWSSTYSSPYYALGVDFSTGDRLVKSKTTSGIVRPIRAFSGEDF